MIDFYKLTEHVRETENPQTYWQHGKFAFINSSILIGGGLLGIFHAIFPWWFKCVRLFFLYEV